MKKLMIAAAIVCAAAFAQAATVSWQSGTIYIANAADGTTGSATTHKANNSTRLVTMYMYALTAQDYTAALAMDTATLYDTYITKTETGKATTLPTGAAAYSQTVADASGANYALLLFVDTKNANLPEGKDAFVKATLATAQVDGSAQVNMSNMINSSLASDWTAVPVPEPTSGLLLLLGVAGMALRRRRA
jgi:hypothetical protein